MLKFKLNIKATMSSIVRLRSILPRAMKGAVRNTSRAFLTRIVEKTPAPPTPLGQIYVRTGRLRAGWQDAGAELGIGVPSFTAPPYLGYYGASPRGSDLGGRGFEEIVNKDKVSFLMRDRVPYAFFVEVVGPGFPPRGGVLMVTRSSFESQSDFEREVQVAWAGLVI